MAPQRVFQLSGTCNNYPWGRKGKQSLAAQLCAKTPGLDFKIEDDQFYSEMWFGDYPDFPARVLETGELLADAIKKDQDTLLGKKVLENMDAQLPFLPKILSIAKALPLQLHPNKDLATKLHKQDPDQFTDPNHKPEIAVALSFFEVFAGFKPLEDVQSIFTLSALSPYLPAAPVEQWSNETLREVTRNLLKADEATVKTIEKDLLNTPRSALSSVKAEYILDLLPRLQDQYDPGDAGSIVALTCMNFLTFEALDAIYIPADGIHAYLSGDIVECMARSNNVLNVGFCPAADRNNVDMFANTLTFKSHSREDVVLPRQKSERSKTGKTEVYKPPMSEFDMLVADFKAGESDEIKAGDGPGVFIVTKGSGKMSADGTEFDLKEGFIFYIAPGVDVKWETESGLQIFEAVI
ncbi:Mannose-6-phosphate isomerase [Cytospora mali]|uniref:Mannose-6-phosphate isomerase n=1 Tax=Cytospora mali TaxID=578113 RepID=A0A194V5L4_CYTMA|nr:Mannose-6-phosphate isomerase [Valsa mali var. pyri (nom. inval.)]